MDIETLKHVQKLVDRYKQLRSLRKALINCGNDMIQVHAETLGDHYIDIRKPLLLLQIDYEMLMKRTLIEGYGVDVRELETNPHRRGND